MLGAAPGQACNAETWKQPEMVSTCFIAGSGKKGTGQFGAVAAQCPGTTAPSCHGAAALPSRSIWRGGCVLGSPEAAGARISSQGHGRALPAPVGSGHGQESSLLLHVPLGPQAPKERCCPELALAAPTVTLSWAPQGCGPFCLPPGADGPLCLLVTAPAPQPPHCQEPACRRGRSPCCSTCGPRDTPRQSCTGPSTSHLPWGWGTLPPSLQGRAPWALWGTALRPPGVPASTHLQGRPCRHGRGWCWCTSAPGGTAGRCHTPARTARGLRPGSLRAQPPAVTHSWLQGRWLAAQQAECSPLPPGTATATHAQAQPVLQHFSSRRQALSSRHWLLCLCRGSQHGSALGHSPGCSAGAGQREGSPPSSSVVHTAAPCPVPGAEPGPGCWRLPLAGREQRMAQPSKQHFSCRGQSLSWPQASSVHGSGACRGLTFGHWPGLSEREVGRGAAEPRETLPWGASCGRRCPSPVGPLRWPQPRAPCPEEV